jgi:FKBP-type peptidyl-prolyl cis-trans isomerase SlyD
MQITQHKHVTLGYKLKDDKGVLLDSTEDRDPFAYIHGTGSIIPAIEQALVGKAPGDDVNLRIPSEHAYGERNENLVFTTSITSFDNADNLSPGVRVRVRTSSGEQILSITNIDDDQVTLDGNHPLAGVNLNFEISVVGVRDCTPEELQQADASPESGQSAEESS